MSDSFPRIRRWLSETNLADVVAAAPRPELEQASLRLVLIGIVYLYLLYNVFGTSRDIDHSDWQSVFVGAFLVSFSVFIAAWILLSPEISVARRVGGIVCDNATTTYFLLQAGEGGAIVFFVYLFVTFGNGFRYGRFYLHLCQTFALIGFSLVLAVSDFWSRHPSIGAAFFIALIVLPFYVGVLIQRITEAKNSCE